MRALRMAWRTLRREWRHGELVVLLLSLSVAIASQSGVGFLVDRVGRAIDLQASEVLAADMRIESNGPLAEANEPQARALDLRAVRLTTLLSAVFHNDANQLANVGVFEREIQGPVEIKEGTNHAIETSYFFTENGDFGLSIG